LAKQNVREVVRAIKKSPTEVKEALPDDKTPHQKGYNQLF